MGFEMRGALYKRDISLAGWKTLEAGTITIVTPTVHRVNPWDISSRITAVVNPNETRLNISVERKIVSDRNYRLAEPEHFELAAGSERVVRILRGERFFHQLFRYSPKK